MSKRYAAILAEAVPKNAKTDERARAVTREKLQGLLAKASRAQQRELRWRIVPYNVTSGGEFITTTANLEGLPWILLDLRGRLQPFLLRIGVGIGELEGHFQQPAKNLTGPCITLAREALDSLRAEHLLLLESRASRISEPQDARGGSHSSSAIGARCPLTRYHSVNFDFDAAVTEICKLQDPLIHKMHVSEWSAFVPNARFSKPASGRRRRRSEDAFDAHRERSGESGQRGLRCRKPLRVFQRAYFAQLMAASAGVQHLITERFLAQCS
ncbi:MAG TPA: hypothetical protein VFU57_10560 [Candidatus Acidoferrales bacterium]|nr:hypothetical protein [Candidatus Acidoferrales bacterium]